MKRISKKPDERKEEIIHTAQKLFIDKGFVETKISDIVKTIKVSQGVFYYYFNSKEEIIGEIVDRYIKQIVKSSSDIIENREMSALEKLNCMSVRQLKINIDENNNIHAIKGVDIHERILKRLILDYVPLMARAFHEKGDKETLYKMELFVSSANVLFDPGIFQWDKIEKNERIEFLIRFMEENFGLKKGDFSFYKKLMGYED
jgi:AcrR family transcriptional regulator